jgi:hypothetical protein
VKFAGQPQVSTGTSPNIGGKNGRASKKWSAGGAGECPPAGRDHRVGRPIEGLSPSHLGFGTRCVPSPLLARARKDQTRQGEQGRGSQKGGCVSRNCGQVTKSTILIICKCPVKEHYRHSCCHATVPSVHLQDSALCKNETLFPIKHSVSLCPSQPLAPTMLLSVSRKIYGDLGT